MGLFDFFSFKIKRLCTSSQQGNSKIKLLRTKIHGGSL